MKKLLAMLLAVIFVFSGCGVPSEQSETPDTNEAPAAESQATDEGEEEVSYLISEEPIELTAHIHYKNAYVLSDEWTVEDEVARLTNISLVGTASPMETNSVQAFNLMIASKDIPDLVGGLRNDINNYGMEGAFIPLNDLIEEHAPDIKLFLDENPDIKTAITAPDGNIYQIPYVFDTSTAWAWFIRKDWLDNLGLEIPTTVDEMHDVLEAFVNDDPNGNGKQDEIGLIEKIGGETENKVKSPLALFGVTDYWHTNEEGDVAIGLYTQEYKEAVKNVSQWYSEGLIDPEVFTRGTGSASALFPEDNGGVLHYWIPSTSNYNRTIPESVPGFELVPILPPVDINGDQWESSARELLPGNGWAISSQNEYPVESIKYMNFRWTEYGRNMAVYGIEGDTFTMVDGEPQYTEKVLTADSAVNDYMRKIGSQIDDMGYLHDTNYEFATMHPIGVEAHAMYEEAGVVNKINVKLPPISFTQEELDLIQSKYPVCRTYMLEQLQKWVMDGSTIDDEFDEYMNNLADMGMDEIVQAYQHAYETFMETSG